MKFIYFLLLLSNSIWSSNPPKAIFVNSFEKSKGQLLAVDLEGNFTTYSEQNVRTNIGHQSFKYGSLNTGIISQADQFTPLQTALLFRDFNQLIVLDDRLSELAKIDFNALLPFRDVSHIAMAGSNQIWIFDALSQTLQKFDFFQQNVLAATNRITEPVRTIQSNTTYCWALTANNLWQFNSQGGLIKKMDMPNFQNFILGDGFIILCNPNGYFLLQNSSEKPQKIIFDKMFSGSFFLQGQTLYIYDEKTIHEYLITF